MSCDLIFDFSENSLLNYRIAFGLSKAFEFWKVP